MRAMKWMRSVVVVAVAVGALTGCATYGVETPSEMIALEESRRLYTAMTHDGVVVRARVMRQGERKSQIPRGDQEFWVHAIRERMRTAGGYALLGEREVSAASGEKGVRLEFGRDQNGDPYHYWVTIFVTEKNIHVLDAGGRKDRFEAAQDAVEEVLSSYEVRR